MDVQLVQINLQDMIYARNGKVQEHFFHHKGRENVKYRIPLSN